MSLQKFNDSVSIMAFGSTKAEAHNAAICISCKQPIYIAHENGGPGAIYSQAGFAEYNISGLCEHCFDKLFS